MGRIILARHGQDEDNAAEILNGARNKPLTKVGEEQAHELAIKLMISSLSIKHIFCSPLIRARKTADICSTYLGAPLTILPCLIERNHGILEGHPYSDIPLLAKSWREKNGKLYVVEVEGGEGYPRLCERAADALATVRKHIYRLRIFGDSLVVCHSAIGRAIEAAHKGMGPDEMFERLTSFKNCEYRILE